MYFLSSLAKIIIICILTKMWCTSRYIFILRRYESNVKHVCGVNEPMTCCFYKTSFHSLIIVAWVEANLTQPPSMSRSFLLLMKFTALLLSSWFARNKQTYKGGWVNNNNIILFNHLCSRNFFVIAKFFKAE